MHFQASRTNAVTTSQLRAAGSRTIAAADTVQTATGGVAIAGGGAVGLLSTVNDAGQQATGIATSVANGKESVSLFADHWQIVVIALLVGVVGFLLWKLWRAHADIVAARLDDARTGTPADQVLIDNPITGSVLDGIEFEEPAPSDHEQRPPIYPGEWHGGE